MVGNASTVKERLDIADIIGGYLKLERAGANFKARCPFHNEKTPSFMVNMERQTFYCFGCGKSGDVFTFVEEIEGLDFRDTLKMLAEKAGVELEYSGQNNGETKDEKEKLYQVLDDAALWFESNLKSTKSALDYLHKRGITDESIEKWRIGYVPDAWRGLRTHLLSIGHTDELLLKAGLIKKTDIASKEPYDTFRGRIMFPLADPFGRIIAFSGRAEGDLEPKYLNSPDTPLFTKSEVLYGLDKAKDAIRKSTYTVLVEGQVDLVLSHQAGVSNTVASSGTAFTAAHLTRLKRLSPRIILAFDGDGAGEKAAEKSSILALTLGMEVKVAEMPTGKDPADLVKEDPESWKVVLRKSVHAIEYFLNHIISAEPDARKRGKLALAKILPMIALVDSSIERSHFITLVSKRLGVREDVLWDDLTRVKVPEAPRTDGVEEIHVVAASKPSMREQIEQSLLGLEAWKDDATIDQKMLKEQKHELECRLEELLLKDERAALTAELATAEAMKDEAGTERLKERIRDIHRKQEELDIKKKVV